MNAADAIPRVKYFIAILYTDDNAFDRAVTSCEAAFGPIDLISDSFPFDQTNYYENEMGPNLNRRFMSFEKLENAGNLGVYKAATNLLEKQFAEDGRRTVNLDIGYLDYDKVVLASAKYNWQKIYLSDGFYADLTLYYRKGNFQPFEWSFPDFKLPTYYPVFLEIRNRFKTQMRGAQPPMVQSRTGTES